MSFNAFFRTPGAPLILPLSAFYRRDPELEGRRARFYRLIAQEFQSQGWKLYAAPARVKGKAGRDGRRQAIDKGTTKNPTIRDARAGAAEYLQTGSVLNDPATILASDDKKRSAESYGEIRRKAARDYVELHDIVSGSVLASPDWMREGHGSTKPGSIAVARLEAAGSLNVIRASMPDECAALANLVLIEDRFVWERVDEKGRDLMPLEERKAILEDLRMALDFIAMGLGWISRDRMLKRWPLARREYILRPAVDRARRER